MILLIASFPVAFALVQGVNTGSGEIRILEWGNEEVSDPIAAIPVGDEFKVLAYMGNGWYEVSYKGLNGYIFKDDSPKSSRSWKMHWGVNTGNYEIRILDWKNQEVSDKFSSIPVGDAFEVIDCAGYGWYRILYKGLSGYIFKDNAPARSWSWKLD